MSTSHPRFKRKNNRNGRPHGRPGSKRRSNSSRKKTGSDIPHHKFVQTAAPLPIEQPVETRPFRDLDLHDKLQKAIRHKGYTHTTPIQDQAIEPILDGRDVLGIAQTGTGKTAAFLIPMIDRWVDEQRAEPALVIVPTRELAIQVTDEFRTLTERLRLYSATFIGGGNVNTDIRKLQRFHHLIVGTPGRLLDLADRGALDLGAFSTLVLDEFDRMLDMGFIRDIRKLVDGLTNRRQTLLFSATIERDQEAEIDRLLYDPITVQVSSGTTTAEHIEQDVVRVRPGENKLDRLQQLLHDEDMHKVLIFLETKHRVKRLTKQLVNAGYAAAEIHGNRSQNQRQKALMDFRKGRVDILVATDVAARGLDISDVSHVINFEPPRTYDSYIHRIGRTGRAGKAGKAYTFVEEKETVSR